jgi:YidC/Oxa1 family membrane protein insertase
MERRLLLTFGLTFLVIILFQPVLKKYFPQFSPAPPAQTQNQNQPQNPPVQSQNAAANPAQVSRAPVKGVATATTKQASAESEIVIENDLYRITFTNRGAQVKSWILKKFNDDKGQPLELVNRAAAERFGYPLSLWTYDENQRDKLNSVLYVTSTSGTLHAPAEISFDYADQDFTVHKSLRFDQTYIVTSVTA